MPNSRSVRCSYVVAPLSAARSAVGGDRLLPHRLQLARRPRQDDDRRPRRDAVAPSRGGTTSPGAVPTGSSTVGARGDRRLLAVGRRRSPRGSRFGQRLASGATIFAIRSASASSSTISRPWKRAHDLGRQVVGRRAEPAAREHQVDAPAPAMKPSAACMSSRPVADDRDVREVDAELAQPFRQPRAVAVADAAASAPRCPSPRSQLARSRSYLQVGRLPIGSRLRPAFVIE